MGIALRTALLSWLVTIVTLLIFVTFIIPQQKRTFLENLESKAHGIAVSLRDVAAGAAVNEDFSSVVDHCKEMLNGDKALDYLVITKNDGFSLINERGGWRSEFNVGKDWRPDLRQPVSGIGFVTLFNRRVFHYSQPFDYSGIQWGWIHVGLSLESYDRSVAAVYQRTVILAIICILFGLLASVLYAKRLVRPILNLQSVVRQVAAGDFSACAVVEARDEVGDLARAFNTMTDALLQRDQILQSVRFAAQQFLTTPNWRAVVDGILAEIGQAAKGSRVYLFENSRLESGETVSSQRFEWCAAGISVQLDNPGLQNLRWVEGHFIGWAAQMSRGEIVTAHIRSLEPAEREFLEAQQIQSLILIPIRVANQWWGFLGLDECHYDRIWSDAERDSLRAAADMISAAITRKRAEDALLEAKATLERRVLERTSELRAQVAAKEQVLSDLAEAQGSLVELSRQAGMAEVATGVLHNVGNVLNSVNVSCTLIIEQVQHSRIENVAKLAALLAQPKGGLARFLTEDPRGLQIPAYLDTLASALNEERELLLRETAGLREKVDHIKEIVAMQQSYGSVSGVSENIPPAQLINDALRLNTGALARHGVAVEREFQAVPPIVVDKHRVLQILLNLIRNAKYACDEGGQRPKLIKLRVFGATPGRVTMQVCDNGVGIPPENLTRVFQHGFTTRKGGHGFGLHSGALAARELGGTLSASSNGLGCGATFTLELPCQPPGLA